MRLSGCAELVEGPARTGAHGQVLMLAGGEAMVARERDHRGIVGAEGNFGGPAKHCLSISMLSCVFMDALLEHVAQIQVGRNTSNEMDFLYVRMSMQCTQNTVDKVSADSVLVRSSEIGRS